MTESQPKLLPLAHLYKSFVFNWSGDVWTKVQRLTLVFHSERGGPQTDGHCCSFPIKLSRDTKPRGIEVRNRLQAVERAVFELTAPAATPAAAMAGAGVAAAVDAGPATAPGRITIQPLAGSGTKQRCIAFDSRSQQYTFHRDGKYTMQLPHYTTVYTSTSASKTLISGVDLKTMSLLIADTGLFCSVTLFVSSCILFCLLTGLLWQR
jgi:hypothetical protein